MTSLFFIPLSHLTVDRVFLFRRLVIVFKESPGEKKVSPVGAWGDCSLTNPIPSPHLLLLPAPILLNLFFLLLSFLFISHTRLLLTIHLPAQWISLCLYAQFPVFTLPRSAFITVWCFGLWWFSLLSRPIIISPTPPPSPGNPQARGRCSNPIPYFRFSEITDSGSSVACSTLLI